MDTYDSLTEDLANREVALNDPDARVALKILIELSENFEPVPQEEFERALSDHGWSSDKIEIEIKYLFGEGLIERPYPDSNYIEIHELSSIRNPYYNS